MTDQTESTPPLDEFLIVFNEDDNEWWRIDCGHHLNLFEAAVDERDAAVARAEAAEQDAAAAKRFVVYVTETRDAKLDGTDQPALAWLRDHDAALAASTGEATTP